MHCVRKSEINVRLVIKITHDMLKKYECYVDIKKNKIYSQESDGLIARKTKIKIHL